MTHVATLIGPPNALVPAALTRARAALPGASGPQPLGPGAADIPFTLSMGVDQRAIALRAIAERLRGLIAGVDVVVQPQANRRKKLFVADNQGKPIRSRDHNLTKTNYDNEA